MEHGPWQVITVRLDGRARVEQCLGCGVVVTRIGPPTSTVVSQPACRLVPAGADRSTT